MRRALTPLTLLFAVGAALIGIPLLRSGGSRSAADTAAPSPVNGRFQGPIRIGGGRELYLRCAGTGSPTVILESGIHDSSDTWTLTDTTSPVLPSPSVFAGVARLRPPRAKRSPSWRSSTSAPMC